MFKRYTEMINENLVFRKNNKAAKKKTTNTKSILKYSLKKIIFLKFIFQFEVAVSLF